MKKELANRNFRGQFGRKCRRAHNPYSFTSPHYYPNHFSKYIPINSLTTFSTFYFLPNRFQVIFISNNKFSKTRSPNLDRYLKNNYQYWTFSWAFFSSKSELCEFHVDFRGLSFWPNFPPLKARVIGFGSKWALKTLASISLHPLR